MTRDQVIDLLMVIQAAYPNYNPQDKTIAVNTWHMMLADYDYQVVMAAVKTYIATNRSGFAPSIGEVINCIQSITTPDDMSESEAWSMVRKAIGNSAYHCLEEFNQLPVAVQKAVGSPSQLRSWAMDEEFNESVASSNFMRAYRTEIAKQHRDACMPEDVKALMQSIVSENQIEDKRNVAPAIESDKGDVPRNNGISERTKRKLEELRNKHNGKRNPAITD